MGVLLDALDYLRDADSWTGPGGMLELLVQQLLVTLTALLAAMLVGLPVALWLGHLGRGGFLAINISNVGRAVPTFALRYCVLCHRSEDDRPPLGTHERENRVNRLACSAVDATTDQLPWNNPQQPEINVPRNLFPTKAGKFPR